MAILKKTTAMVKPTAAKPAVKATLTKVMVDKKTGKETKSAPVSMKSKSMTSKEFFIDKKIKPKF